MNHKWKNIGRWGDIKHNDNWISVSKPKECIRCGLKKANIPLKYGWKRFSEIAYYKDPEKILSMNKLPYRCKEKLKDFLTKEDFYV
jgi:hypothetical protein